jgi:phosphoglycolate phosphatase
MKLVLFDVDGTLVDSVKLIHECMARSFEAFGYARPEVAQTKSIIGLTLDIAIARMLGREEITPEIQAMTAKYKEVFTDVRSTPGYQEVLYLGISEMIRQLAARDEVLLGIVTGKGRRGLNFILDTHQLRKHIIVSRTADDCASKPNPAMVLECCRDTGMDVKDTYVIGDAVFDMQMARSAGAHAIAVDWGYASVSELQGAGAEHIVHHPKDIPAIIPNH